MGRSIYCGDDFIWKYAFARQSSEQSRITEEHQLGEVQYREDGDTLTLSINDLDGLKEILKSLDGFEEAKKIYNEGWGNEGSLPIEMVDIIDAKAKAACNDLYFGMMIERMIKYMEKQFEEHKIEDFDFDGEY